MKQSNLTIGDLLDYAQRAQRLSYSNYVGCPDAYKQDRNAIKRAKNKAKKIADFYWFKKDAPLIIGKYSGTRLIVEKNKLDYIAGQYAPTEIWHAVYNYFESFKSEVKHG